MRDAAALHVAALVLEGLEGQRVFGWAERIRGRGVLTLWRSCILGAQLRGYRIRGGFERAAEGEGRGAFEEVGGPRVDWV